MNWINWTHNITVVWCTTQRSLLLTQRSSDFLVYLFLGSFPIYHINLSCTNNEIIDSSDLVKPVTVIREYTCASTGSFVLRINVSNQLQWIASAEVQVVIDACSAPIINLGMYVLSNENAHSFCVKNENR